MRVRAGVQGTCISTTLYYYCYCCARALILLAVRFSPPTHNTSL